MTNINTFWVIVQPGMDPEIVHSENAAIKEIDQFGDDAKILRVSANDMTVKDVTEHLAWDWFGNTAYIDDLPALAFQKYVFDEVIERRQKHVESEIERWNRINALTTERLSR